MRWLLTNGSLLPPLRARRVGALLCGFRDICLHQSILRGQESYALLERILHSSYTGVYDQLEEPHQREVVGIVSALGVLETEVDDRDPAFPMKVKIVAGFQGLAPPYYDIAFPGTSLPISSSPYLSDASVEVIRKLLDESPSLPLLLASSTVRLAVQISSTALRVPGQYSRVVRGIIKIGRATMILKRRALMEPVQNRRARRDIHHGHDSSTPPETPGLDSAVCTIIYVALSDSAFPRLRLAAPEAGPHSWIQILVDILIKAPLNAPLRRQLCWAICVVSWRVYIHLAQDPSDIGVMHHSDGAQHPSSRGVLSPRIPRLSSTPPHLLFHLADVFTAIKDELIKYQSGVAKSNVKFSRTKQSNALGADASRLSRDLNSILVTMDHVLRDWIDETPGFMDNIGACTVIRSSYTELLKGFEEQLSTARFPRHCLLPQMLETMTNIALCVVTLPTDVQDSDILPTLLSIFHDLIAVDPDVLEDIAHCWIYRTSCSIVTFYLDQISRQFDYRGLATLPRWAYEDAISAEGLAMDLISTIKHINSYKNVLNDPTIVKIVGPFSAITRQIFIPDGGSLRGGSGVGWQEVISRVVMHFVQKGGLNVLMESGSRLVQTGPYTSALNILHSVMIDHSSNIIRLDRIPSALGLYSRNTPYDPIISIPRRNPTKVLIEPCARFLEELEMAIRIGQCRYAVFAGATFLIKLVELSVHLTFSAPSAKELEIDALFTMQSFFSALIFGPRAPSRHPAVGERATALVIGLLRVLVASDALRTTSRGAASRTAGTIAESGHCDACRLSDEELARAEDWMSTARAGDNHIRSVRLKDHEPALQAMMNATMWAIHTLWGGWDKRYMGIRRRLTQHGIDSLVRSLLQRDGLVGLFGNLMAYRLGGTERREGGLRLILGPGSQAAEPSPLPPVSPALSNSEGRGIEGQGIEGTGIEGTSLITSTHQS